MTALESLARLDLPGVSLTECAFEPPSQFRKLRQLDLLQVGFTVAAVEHLKQSRPDAEILH
ncbi:MAG: hypothetical protein AAF961_11850 [Planctomycetota bacterium]